MKKDALQKSSTVDNMLKRAEEENKELHRAVKKLKEELRTANEDGKRAGRMVEGLKKQVEELRLEIRVRPLPCATRARARPAPPRLSRCREADRCTWLVGSTGCAKGG